MEKNRCLYCGTENQIVNSASICSDCAQGTKKVTDNFPTVKNELSSKITKNEDDIALINKEYEARVHHNKVVGLWLILTPIVIIFFILFAYALSSFVLKTLTNATGTLN